MVKTKSAIILLVVLCITGCGTILTHKIANEGNSSMYENKEQYDRATCGIGQPYVYSGFVFDGRLLLSPFVCKGGGEGGMIWMGLYPLVFPFILIDIPLSLVADTVVLPYTTYKQITFGNMAQYKQ